MDISAIPRELIIFVVAAVGGVGLGLVTALQGTESKPVWPVRLYLRLLASPWPIKRFIDYPAKRTVFPFREQFLDSSFIWFFALFMTGIIAFGCGRNGC